MWHLFWGAKRDQCSRTRDVLSGYIDRRLDAEESERVEHHLSECQGCRKELESLRATVALLRGLPEVTPSRVLTLAPVKPLPGRGVLPALRFATAAAVMLLVAAFAVDGAGVFEESRPSEPYYAPAGTSQVDTDHWLVAGVRNDIADAENVTQIKMSLVVPDGSDNVLGAVNSLSAGGVVWGTLEVGPEGAPQLVLTEDGGAASAQEDVQEFQVVAATEENESPFAPSGPATWSALDEILKKQQGEFLNVVPANSDNTVLYAFDLSDPVPAEIHEGPDGDSEAKGSYAVLGSNDEAQWLLILEYGLIGLVAALAAATAGVWLMRRRARTQEAGRSRN